MAAVSRDYPEKVTLYLSHRGGLTLDKPLGWWTGRTYVLEPDRSGLPAAERHKGPENSQASEARNDQAATFIEESQGGLVLGEEERERLEKIARVYEAEADSEIEWVRDDAAFLRKLASQPAQCGLCEGEGQVAKNFGIDSPGRPEIVPCPRCQPAPVLSGEAEAIARAFHDAYEDLAPSYGYTTREESAKPWDEVPEMNRKLMVATVERILPRLNPHPLLSIDKDGNVSLVPSQPVLSEREARLEAALRELTQAVDFTLTAVPASRVPEFAQLRDSVASARAVLSEQPEDCGCDDGWLDNDLEGARRVTKVRCPDCRKKPDQPGKIEK